MPQDIKPFAQKQQPRRRVKREYDPLDVFIGTTLESFIDMASFGIFQPDIIPEWAEQESPLATTIGRIAGNLAGFLPSYGLVSATTKGVFKTFKFSDKILRTAQALTKSEQLLQKAAPAAFAITGIGETAISFALFDTAREFVNQTKTDNYDLYAMGHTAVSGLITGGMFGAAGAATHTLHPLKQATAMGSTIMLAEAINDAAEGEDVLSKDYLTGKAAWTFLQGAAIGLWNSKGWKERLSASEQASTAKLLEGIYGERKISLSGDIQHKTIIDKLNELGKKTELPQELKIAIRVIQEGKVKRPAVGKELRESQKVLKQLQRFLKWDDKVYKENIKEWTGKTSSKQFTKEDYDLVFSGIDDYMAIEIPKTVKRFGDAKIWDALKPADRWLLSTHMKDISGVANLELAESLRIMEATAAREAIWGMQASWKRLWHKAKPGKKLPLGKRIRQETDPAAIDFANRIQHKGEYDPKLIVHKKPTDGLNPEMKKLYNDYTEITDIYFERVNQVWKLMGKKPIAKKEFYMRHFLDYAKMKKAGIPREEMPTPGFGEMPFGRKPAVDKFLSTAMQRKGGLEQFMHNDPWKALENMIHYDLKAIYLHEPNRIAQAQMKQLVESGALTGKQAESLNKWINMVIWKMPTEKTQIVNNQILKSLEKQPMKAIDRIFSEFGIDIGKNPMEELAGVWGSLVSKAFIGFRPRLAIRNSFQMLYAHGFVSTKNLAKGMSPREPKMYTDMRNKDIFWKMSKGQAEEHITTGRTAIERAAFAAFQQSHVNNVNITMKATYYQTMEYVQNPKHNKLGWATKQGIKNRKTNSNYLDPIERGFIEKEMQFVASHTQFLYNNLGMPLMFRSGVAKPFFKLMSYPMNYTFKYLGELSHRAITGRPFWAGQDGPKLPKMQQYGILKHFVWLSALVGSLEKFFDMDYSSIVGMSWTPEKERRGIFGTRVKPGVLQARPSPGMQVLLSLKDSMSTDEYTRKMGRKQLNNTLLIYPYKQAFKDVRGALTEGDRKKLFFYPTYKPSGRKPKTPQPFGEFPTYKPFTSVYGGR